MNDNIFSKSSRTFIDEKMNGYTKGINANSIIKYLYCANGMLNMTVIDTSNKSTIFRIKA